MDEQLYRTFFAIEKVHWWFAARMVIVQDLIRRHLAIPPGSAVLDVGCGTGAILEMLSQTYDAYGTDSSALAIEYCRTRGLTQVVQSNLGPGAFPGKKFDLITFLDVIEHLDDDREILLQAGKSLTPNGRILVTVPAYPWLWSHHDEVNHHRRRYQKATLRNVLADAGFQVQRISFFNTLLFPAALLQRLTARTGRNDSALDVPPPLLNAALRQVFASERLLLRFANFPFGLSLFAEGILRDR